MPKHFFAHFITDNKVTHERNFAEVKRFCPVTLVKLNEIRPDAAFN
jgi:hypothetical protein